jgi:hypothetical protein
LAGPVEIDESLVYKKKGIVGRIPRIHYWVFGIKCRVTGTLMLFPVNERKQDTLMQIIKNHVK